MGLCIFRRLFAVLLAGVLLDPASAQEGDWKATYAVSYGGSAIGELHRQVRVEADSYHFTSRLVPKGMGRIFSSDTIEQSSSGSVDPQGYWRPDNYFYSNSSKPDKPHDFLFDWQSEEIRFGEQSLALAIGGQDELSQMQVLARRLAAGEREINLQVLNGSKRRIYEYRYRVEGEVSVPLAGNKETGEPALLVNLTTSRGKYLTRFWLSPARNYLPLRIERTQLKKRQTVVMQLVVAD